MSKEKWRKTLACFGLFALFAPAASAQSDFYYPLDPDWRFRLNLGFGLWESQHNLDPAGPGEFDEGPVTFEIGGDVRLADWDSMDLFLGIDAGIMTTESDIEGQFTSPTSDLGYLLPSLALYFGDVERPRLNLRAGFGRYSVEYSEWLDLTSLNRSFSEASFGGFVGAGVDFPLQFGSGRHSITLDTRTHFVDFGDVTRLGPDAGKLEGPIWTVQLGWAVRF